MSQSIYEEKLKNQKKKKKKSFSEMKSSAAQRGSHYWLNRLIDTDIGALITREENQLISLDDDGTSTFSDFEQLSSCRTVQFYGGYTYIVEWDTLVILLENKDL